MKLAILDLDETLIYGSQSKLERAEDFIVFDYFIYKRPKLDEFLIDLSKHYQIAVWSSAGEEYVQEVSKYIKPDSVKFQFIWSRDRAVYKRNFNEYEDFESHYHYVKPLKKIKKLGFELKDVLIIDDSPHKSSLNYGNAIYPKPYEGDKNDNELELLLEYLIMIKDKEDFRRLEKRNWRNKIKHDH